MRTALCGVGFASLLFVVAAEVLAAGPSPEDLRAARELFASAEKDEDAGKWSDALDKLGRVAQVRSTSGVRYHIALCEEHLGRLAHALDDYVQAEIQARNDGAQDVLRLVGGRVGQLKDRVPRLSLSVPPDAPPDTEIDVDGDAIARPVWGTPLPLDPGSHEVRAKAAGHVGFSTTIAMAERDNVVVEVKLPEARTVPAPAPSPAHESASAAPGDTSSSSSGSPRTLAIVLTAGTVALAAGGVGAFVIAGNDHNNAKATCATRTTPCDDLRGPTRTWDAVALGAWIGAAASGALAIVLWLRPPAEGAPRPGVGLVVGPESLGVAGGF
jgi:hypothetical protein